MTDFLICVGMQLCKGSEYSSISRHQVSAHAQGFEYA